MPATASALNVPFIGCASHRLHLAVTEYIEQDISFKVLVKKNYRQYEYSENQEESRKTKPSWMSFGPKVSFKQVGFVVFDGFKVQAVH